MKLLSNKACFLVAITMISTCMQLNANTLKTIDEKEAYSIGASTGLYVGNQIVRHNELGLKVDIDKVVDGFVDALQQKLLLEEKDIIEYLNTRVEKLNKAQEKQFNKLKSDNKKKEDMFLAKNKAKKGVIQTKSGLQYEIIKKGKGNKTKPESIAVVNYKAYLIDGYVFENFTDSKDPKNLSMINVIEGLKEGLLLMNADSKYKFYIPSKLGYKDEQIAEIGPNSTLVFEVELRKILKPGDLKPKEKFELIENKGNSKVH